MKLKGSFISEKYNRTLPVTLFGTMISALTVSVDVIIAGILLGEAGASAINAVNPIVSLATFNCVMFGVGTGVIYGEKMGSFDKKGADRTFGLGLVGAISIGILFLILTLSFKSAFFNFYGFDPSVAEMAETYYSWVAVCMCASPAYFVCYNMVFFDGEVLIPLVSTVSQLIIKTVGSFILVPRFGISGFGITGLLQIIVSAILVLSHFLKKTNTLHPILNFSLPQMWKIISFSAVDSCAYLYTAIFVAFLNKYVGTVFGSRGLILVSLIYIVQQLGFGLDGVGLSMEAFVNVYKGQNSISGVRNVFRLSMKTAAIFGIIFGALIFGLAGPIAGYLGITDPEIFRISVSGIRILAVTQCINSLQFCLTSYYLLIGRIGLSVFDVTVKNLILEIVLGLIFSQIFGMIGLFVGILLGDLLAFAILLILVRARFGREGFPLTLSHEEGIRDDVIYEYDIQEASIVNIKQEVRNCLIGNGYGNESVTTVMLIVEELSMLIKELNPLAKAPIKAECALILGEDISIVLCDNGKLVDLADPDSNIRSFREYVSQNVIAVRTTGRQNLITAGYNRRSFVVPGKLK